MSSFVETFEPPHLGMDTESAPHRLAKAYSRDLLNMLTGTPGRIRPRGGITSGGVAIDMAVRDIWVNASGHLLFSAFGTGLRYVSNHFGVFTSVGGGGTQHGPIHTQVGELVYGFASDGRFLRWAGDATAPVAYSTTNAPRQSKAITYWLNRLWCLAGMTPGTTPATAERLFWSDLTDGSAALPDTLAAWQDDVSGLVNQIVLPTVGQGGNSAVGFGRLANALVVFGSRSSDMLIGSSPSGVTVRPHVTRGALDQRAILEHNGGVMWLAPEGLFYFDGAQEVELSAQIRSYIQRYTGSHAAGGDYFVVRLPNDYFMVTMVTNLAGNVSLLFHLPTKSWSRVIVPTTPTALLPVNGTYSTGGVTRALLWDSSYLWRLDGMAQLDDWLVAGVDALPDASGHQPFQAYLDSRVSILAAPSTKAAVRRIAATSIADRSTTAPTGTEGWQIAAHDTREADVLAPSSLTSTDLATSAGLTNLRRNIFEPNAEADEIYVHAEFNGGASVDFTAAELHDITIEYDVVQKPASF